MHGIFWSDYFDKLINYLHPYLCIVPFRHEHGFQSWGGG
jgi:hypothetical protein